MPLTIVENDITRMHVDAIVNAANPELKMGGGVCGAIFKAAGEWRLKWACKRVAPIYTGQAALTKGFKLPAKFIIHAVGPIYDPCHKENCEKLLYQAYTSALQIAVNAHCESIAFPLISSDIYGYPKSEALNIARCAIANFLKKEELDVYLVIQDKSILEISPKLHNALEDYILRNYDKPKPPPTLFRLGAFDSIRYSISSSYGHCGMLREARMPWEDELDAKLKKQSATFNIALVRLIQVKGKTETEVYKRANLDRKLFSKIRTGNGYLPKKNTILALAIALELSLEETNDLLEKAGYTLSKSIKGDIIVSYFIETKFYNILIINEVLFKYGMNPLGRV